MSLKYEIGEQEVNRHLNDLLHSDKQMIANPIPPTIVPTKSPSSQLDKINLPSVPPRLTFNQLENGDVQGSLLLPTHDKEK